MHATASVRIAAGSTALVIHHPKLKVDAYPGGHVDEGEHPGRAALREAREEVGVDLSGAPTGSIRLLGVGFHAIPAIGREPFHWHADLLYGVDLPPNAPFHAQCENVPFAWRDDAALVRGYWRIPADCRQWEDGL